MNRLFPLGGLAYALILAGLAMRIPGLLALALLPLAYLAAAVIWGPQPLRLKAVRTIVPDRASDGTPVAVRVSITNEGPDLEQVFVEDRLPRRLHAQGSLCLAAALPAGKTLELEYAVLAARGHFEFDCLDVQAADLMGLSRRTAVLSAPARLVVRPHVVRLRRLAIRPIRTRAHAGPVPARVGGSGIDFFGVRDYQPGDPQRWINWRASARHEPGLYTNEFEQERIADVGLILDARSRSDLHLGSDSLVEHSVRAAASLADAFLRDGNRVGLLVLGQYLIRAFPGYGKVQRERILDALCRTEPGNSTVVDSLEYLPTRLFSAQSQIVLVSPVWRDDVRSLVGLRALGYQLLVIRPDPVAFECAGLEPGEARDLAARIQRAERDLMRRQLQHAGAQVVDWPVDRPFGQVMHGSLGRVLPWHRSLRAIG